MDRIRKVRGEIVIRKFSIILLLILSLFVYGTSVGAEDRQIEDELFYEIIVDRYNNGNQSLKEHIDLEDPQSYHGGDFVGITNKLDDLENIGVTTIILSPIMANSENGYHGYWIEDFKAINENFGTLEDLETLIDESHERNMKVVLEFVTNYISEEHEIAVNPEYEEWILTEEVTGPVWTDGVVQLDQDHPEVQEFLMDAATFWLDETDIDGLQLHATDQSSLAFLEQFTGELKESYPDKYLIGDVFDESASIDDMMEQSSLDAIDNYAISQTYADVFSEPDQSPLEIYEILENETDYQSLVFVDDKYSKRFTQRFSENGRNALTTWKLALTMMYTNPGTPVLLQGTESTMVGESAEESQQLVPFAGDQDVVEFHDRISSLRSEFPALRQGDYELEGSTDSFAVFKRTYEDQIMYIAINNGSESAYVDVTDVEEGMMFRGYLEDNVVRANQEGNYRLGIPRESVEVYQLMEDAGYNWTLITFVVGVLAAFVIIIIQLERKQKQAERENQSKE
jgi:alpha-amylase